MLSIREIMTTDLFMLEASATLAGALMLQKHKIGSLPVLQGEKLVGIITCLLYTSPSPRDLSTSRMPSSA